MRANPKAWSDEFNIVDDLEFTDLTDDGGLDDPRFEEDELDGHVRTLSPWQLLEQRLGDRQLRADLSDWDYWDDNLAAH